MIRKKHDVKVSIEWRRRFLSGIGLPFRCPAGHAATAFTAVEVVRKRRHLVCKVKWLQREAGIPNDRLFNVDESAVSLLPAGHYSWSAKGAHIPRKGTDYSKSLVTFTVAVPCSGNQKPFTQIVYEGTTARSLPTSALPQNMSVSCSASKWATTSTIMEFLHGIQSTIGPEPWMVLWDAAPTHCSQVTLDAIRAELPALQLAYIDPGTTSITQPLDRSYFRAIKSQLRREFAESVASQLLNQMSVAEGMKKKGELKGDLPHLLDIAVTRAATPERQAQAWAYLCPVSPQAVEDVLAEAGILFAEGRLFVNEGMDPKDDPEVVEEDKDGPSY